MGRLEKERGMGGCGREGEKENAREKRVQKSKETTEKGKEEDENGNANGW